LQRKAIRLKNYDYSQEGAYFVTICTKNREMVLGEIRDERMIENSLGMKIKEVWDKLSSRFPSIETDAFVVMPNHVHGIIIVGAQFIAPEEGSINRAPTFDRAPTLGKIVRVLKAVSTREIRKNYDFSFAWQRNYYEHVIRNEDSLNQIREYIQNNPLSWELDRENPAAKGEDDLDNWIQGFSCGQLPSLQD
jgi:putative transposase